MKKEELINSLKCQLPKGVEIIKKENSKCSFNVSVAERTPKKISELLYSTFKPGISKDEWTEKFNMAISGDGQEWRRITTLHSSSLLALLFFSSVNKDNPICVADKLFDKVYFEVKNRVFKNSSLQDKPSNIDVMLVSEDKATLLFLESKFTEYEHNGKVEVSDKYHIFYSRILKHIPNLKFCNGVLELKEGRNSQYIYGIKQMFSHLLGLLSEPWHDSIDEIKELIRNAKEVELGSIVFNWDGALYKKYQEFYNGIFRIFHNNSIILENCLDNEEVDKEKIKRLSLLPDLLSYQDILKENPSFKISNEIRKFYTFKNTSTHGVS